MSEESSVYKTKKVGIMISANSRDMLLEIIDERQKTEDFKVTQIRLLEVLIKQEYERLGLDKTN